MNAKELRFALKQKLHPRELFSKSAAIIEASRCLDCEAAPCRKGCPVGIDIAGFIRRIKTGNVVGALRIIRESNPFPDTCALSCPTEHLCEEQCSATELSYPIKVAELQHYASVLGREFEDSEIKTSESTGFKVGVIGAGPAGLTCAFEAARLGHEVRVFEREKVAGGALSLYIPEYRLPRDVVRREVEYIEKSGAKIHLGAPLCRERTLDKLLAERFHAVFVAAGSHGSAKLEIPGRDLKGIYSALEFIRKTKSDSYFRVRGNVVVVGGGNTSIDAAISAKEAGADDVYLLYRRSFIEMPAWRSEREGLLDQGVHLMILCMPIQYVGDDRGNLKEVRCRQMRLGQYEKDGRRRPIPVDGTELIIPAKTVVESLGLRPESGLAEFLEGVEFDCTGNIKIDAASLMTSRPGVFAGGDLISGGKTVVEAIADGKRGAAAVHDYLAG